MLGILSSKHMLLLATLLPGEGVGGGGEYFGVKRIGMTVGNLAPCKVIRITLVFRIPTLSILDSNLSRVFRIPTSGIPDSSLQNITDSI